MAGVIPKFVHGPVTHQVAETVRGGKIVEARAGGLVGVAAAGSTRVLGVATKDAKPGGAQAQTTDEFGNQVYSSVEVTDRVAVGATGYWPVEYSAAVGFGEAIVVTEDGTVGPAGADADPRALIGYCAQPEGVSAPGVALAKIIR